MNRSNAASRCVPPISWVNRWIVPPEQDQDWQRVSYQPMLYLLAWWAALVVLIGGDFAGVPITLRDQPGGFFWVWTSLSLIAPPMALVSLWLIQNGSGSWKYRGLWLRLGADCGQFSAMLTYSVLRLQLGDFHVYPIATLLASTLFVFHLVLRDVRRLWEVERLATRIYDGDFDPAG